MSLPYKITHKKNEEVLKISFNGSILGATFDTNLLNTELKNAILKGAKECVIDLNKVDYMDSSGLGILITILTKFRNIGGEVTLKSVSEHVKNYSLLQN